MVTSSLLAVGIDSSLDASPSEDGRRAPLRVLIGRDHRAIEVSDRVQELTPLRPGDRISFHPDSFLDPHEGAALRDAYRRVRRRIGASERLTVRIVDVEGRRREFDLVLSNGFADPSVGAIELVSEDVTGLRGRRVIDRLRSRLLDLLPTVVTVVDDVGTIVYCSERSRSVLGIDPADVIGRSIAESNLLPIAADQVEAIRVAAETTGRWEGDVELRRADGSTVPVQLVLERIDDDEIGFHGTVGISFDVTERRKLEDHLDFQASHDALTGLYNRQRFVRMLETALDEANDTGGRLAAMFIDIDDFKAVNDRIGHAAGDALLVAVADRLRSALPDGSIIGRFGGDEFVVYSTGVDDVAGVVDVARGLVDALSVPIGSGTDAVVVSGSVGIALSGQGAPAEELLRRADIAMYVAKERGKNRIEVFDDEVGLRKRRRREMQDELERALDADELDVHFQPELSLIDGRVAALEALTRWHHPDRGAISPIEFIPVAEESGLIHRLGALVIERSCRAMRSWLDAGLGDGLLVAVNVSTRQFLDHGFPDTVARLLDESGVSPEHLCLEVTESALVDADVALRALGRLDEIGVSIALDDFGTGYSSLSRLSKFPLDFMKIDRSFVANLDVDPASAVIVQMVVDLAHALGLQTIAEGIETQEQLQRLAAAGCDIGQGFLWSPSVTFDEATALLRNHDRRRVARGLRAGSYRGVQLDLPIGRQATKRR
ncbi:MAG: EAL domain-containing protein [Ilumatobacter sp.]|nr:EAL domain-containing protein [Ilumatobacter sp.]